jgi:hypothetical protein
MSDDTDIMRRTASADMQANFEKICMEYPMKVSTAQHATAMFFVQEDYVKVWNKQLAELESNNETELTPQQRRVFIEHLNLQYSILVTEKIDPLSRVFVRSYNASKHKINWKFPQCLLWNFSFSDKSQGVYGCIDGVPRSGKTSLACTLMPMFNDIGIDVITNIKIRNIPNYIHYVKLLSDTVKKMDELDKWVLILDETATFVDKKRALSEGNIDFENLSRFIGKMGGRLLMITHSFSKDVPTRLQDWTTERFTKLDKEVAKVVLIGDKFKFNNIVDGIPDATLEYVTEDITSLAFDISIRELLEKCQLVENLKKGDVTKIVDDMLKPTPEEPKPEEQKPEEPNSDKQNKNKVKKLILSGKYKTSRELNNFFKGSDYRNKLIYDLFSDNDISKEQFMTYQTDKKNILKACDNKLLSSEDITTFNDIHKRGKKDE